jgi:hypothetical protein
MLEVLRYDWKYWVTRTKFNYTSTMVSPVDQIWNQQRHMEGFQQGLLSEWMWFL